MDTRVATAPRADRGQIVDDGAWLVAELDDLTGRLPYGPCLPAQAPLRPAAPTPAALLVAAVQTLSQNASSTEQPASTTDAGEATESDLGAFWKQEAKLGAEGALFNAIIQAWNIDNQRHDTLVARNWEIAMTVLFGCAGIAFLSAAFAVPEQFPLFIGFASAFIPMAIGSFALIFRNRRSHRGLRDEDVGARGNLVIARKRAAMLGVSEHELAPLLDGYTGQERRAQTAAQAATQRRAARAGTRPSANRASLAYSSSNDSEDSRYSGSTSDSSGSRTSS